MLRRSARRMPEELLIDAGACLVRMVDMPSSHLNGESRTFTEPVPVRDWGPMPRGAEAWLAARVQAIIATYDRTRNHDMITLPLMHMALKRRGTGLPAVFNIRPPIGGAMARAIWNQIVGVPNGGIKAAVLVVWWLDTQSRLHFSQLAFAAPFFAANLSTAAPPGFSTFTEQESQINPSRLVLVYEMVILHHGNTTISTPSAA